MILALALSLVLASIWILYVVGKRSRAMALTVKRRMGVCESHGFFLQPALYYHPGHTWIAVEGNGTVRVGLDDFGRRLVDGIRSVALPAPGSRVRAGMAAIGIDCGSRQAALLSPVDGVITGVNRALRRGGSALERDPYGNGWLFTAKVADDDFSRLPTGKRAFDWLGRESGRLSVFLNDELGATAADGGELIPRPAQVLNPIQWENLVHTFLGTSSEALESAPGKKGEVS